MISSVFINSKQTFKLELIYLYFPPSFHQIVVSVLITTLSTGLVGVEVTSVSWLGTEVTSTPTRPVDNVVITTKGLQDRNNNCVLERLWKIKVN